MVSVIEPLAAAAEEGANVAVNVALPPAVIFVAVLSPAWLNPVPETLIWEMLRVVFPLFVRVIVCELLLPTVTVPKLTLEGFAAICA